MLEQTEGPVYFSVQMFQNKLDEILLLARLIHILINSTETKIVVSSRPDFDPHCTIYSMGKKEKDFFWPQQMMPWSKATDKRLARGGNFI